MPETAACGSRKPARAEPLGADGLEDLILELFRLHDLDGNGLLSEGELIRINEAISEIHHGYPKQDERTALKTKYQQLFRDQLDADGHAVPFGRFREYILRVVRGYDKHAEAQAMIVEQWVAEAHTARLIGNCGAPPPPAAVPTPWKPGTPRPPSQWLLHCCLAHQSATTPGDLCTQGLNLE